MVFSEQLDTDSRIFRQQEHFVAIHTFIHIPTKRILTIKNPFKTINLL